MGVEWGEDEIVVKPFLETTTFKNLEATGVAVVNLTDDVFLFAQGAIANVEFPATPAAVVRGVVLDVGDRALREQEDRKSTRLNSSHDQISYAVFCLKKKNTL